LRTCGIFWWTRNYIGGTCVQRMSEERLPKTEKRTWKVEEVDRRQGRDGTTTTNKT